MCFVPSMRGSTIDSCLLLNVLSVLLSGRSLGIFSSGASCQGLLPHVRNKEDDSENNAESSDNNIADG